MMRLAAPLCAVTLTASRAASHGSAIPHAHPGETSLLLPFMLATGLLGAAVVAAGLRPARARANVSQMGRN